MVPGLITSLLLPAFKSPSSPISAMTVPQEYAEVVAKLPDLQQVLQQQRPWMAGQPFQMKDGSITDAPKGKGNPWKGAYSNHGFWFKLEEGDQKMFDKLVARSYEEDKFLMRYELLEELKAVHGSDVDFIVAANQRGDLIGGVLRGGNTVAVHYVREDYRHSGIGFILIKELVTRARGYGIPDCPEQSSANKELTTTLVSPLYRSIERYDSFQAVKGSTLVHVTVFSPSGLDKIAQSSYRTLTDIDWTAVEKLLVQSNLSIETVKNWAKDGQITVVGDEKGDVKSFVRVVEAAGGYVKRIVVGPLVADSVAAAEAVLHAALLPMLNLTTDYVWNPDVHSLQRRTLHFRVPKDNNDVMGILRKLAGEGSIEVGRVEYQTFSTDKSIKFDAEKTFATEINY
ncbi:hypothetical protein PRIPAC_78935 [Pristionchus pacificus]|uniref:Uncharacterized protein n=1 Tax=Pristionchus pacificus TaxID=54126 RepID=A0A2A6CBV2_PRIPA|nr:hypothetical protein PRIPAC_78935 [Pristionchus pacificus]|eukprot:PDM75558.1 hypothetical protein PRIPAC_42735 [Pristionchus pacificus]